MKENMIPIATIETIVTVVIIILVISFAVIKFFPHKAQAAPENYTYVMDSELGALYIDADSVQILKKNDRLYLAFTVEERYTDKEFLQLIRQNENMQDASSALYLYMFSNDGTYYWVPNRYLVDSQGKICSDLGSIKAQPVNNDTMLNKLYSTALKIMEDKQRLQNMIR